VYDRLIKRMTKHPSRIECATMMLWVSHNLERYADRVSNICERIVYLIAGQLHEPRHDTMP
jgi:phosphate transport system protein